MIYEGKYNIILILKKSFIFNKLSNTECEKRLRQIKEAAL